MINSKMFLIFYFCCLCIGGFISDDLAKHEVKNTELTRSIHIGEKYKDPGYDGYTNYILVDKDTKYATSVHYTTYYMHEVNDVIEVNLTRFQTEKELYNNKFLMFFMFIFGLITLIFSFLVMVLDLD